MRLRLSRGRVEIRLQRDARRVGALEKEIRFGNSKVGLLAVVAARLGNDRLKGRTSVGISTGAEEYRRPVEVCLVAGANDLIRQCREAFGRRRGAVAERQFIIDALVSFCRL